MWKQQQQQQQQVQGRGSALAWRMLCIGALLTYVVVFRGWMHAMLGQRTEIVVEISTVATTLPAEPEQEPEEQPQEEGSEVEVQLEVIPEVCFSELRFARPGLGKMLTLASFPGSGNTWMRHVLQEGTRLYTGSMYGDKTLVDKFPGETVADDSVVAIKSHFPCKKCWQNKKTGKLRPASQTGDLAAASGALLVVRNPFDAMVAEWNRQQTNLSHTGVAPREAFEGPKWEDFVTRATEGWVEHTSFYLTSPVSSREFRDRRQRWVLLTFFERFRTDFASEAAVLFDGVRSQLGGRTALPSTPDALMCVTKDQQGSFHRSHAERFNPFTKAQRRAVCAKTRALWRADVWGPCTGQMQWERKGEEL